MCQMNPFPLCSDHACQLLLERRGEYKANKTAENFQAVRLAQAIYDATPEGQAQLRSIGLHSHADAAEARRDAMLREAEQRERAVLSTPEQRAAYDATATGSRKRTMFQVTQKQWDAGRYRKNVGQLMRLLRSTSPSSLSEWQACYLDAHGELLASEADRFYTDVRATAAPNSTASTITRQEALDIAMFHVIDETWGGYLTEADGVKLAQSLHPDLAVELSDWQVDLWDRVDIVAYSRETDVSGPRRLVRAWQVKPRSFKNANKGEQDVVRLAHEQYEAKTGVKVEFLYEQDIHRFTLNA